jgi:hypothetical protein
MVGHVRGGFLTVASVAAFAGLGHGAVAVGSHGFEPAVQSGVSPSVDRFDGAVDSMDFDDPVAVAAVGDVNGDGLDDIGMIAPADMGRGSNRARVFFGRRPGAAGPPLSFGIQGAHGDTIGPAGDVNGDGLGDIALRYPRETFVVHGQETTDTVIFDRDGEDGFSIWQGHLYEMLLRGSAPGLRRSLGFAAVGDQNADGRDDLAVTDGDAVQLWHSPPSGQVAGTRGARLRFGGESSPFPRSIGDLNGDGREDLLVAGGSWSDPAGGRTYGVLSPAPGETVDLARVAESGRGWVRTDSSEVEAAWASPRVTSSEPAETLAVEAGSGPQYLRMPAMGSSGVLEDAMSSQYSPALSAHVDDMDGDGLTDVAQCAAESRVVLVDLARLDGGQGDPPSGFRFSPDRACVVDSLRDADGDGRRELLVAERSPGDLELTVYFSRGLPDDHVAPPQPPSTSSRPETVNPDPLGIGPSYVLGRNPTRSRPLSEIFGGAPSPPGPEIAADDAFSAAPRYERGAVEIVVRVPRGSASTASGIARRWRLSDEAFELASASGVAGTNPYVRMRLELLPKAQTVLEREGRLRAAITLTTDVRGRRVERSISFAVVARRPPPAAGRDRRVLGGFGVQKLLGTPASDLLRGASGDDELRGGDGSDALHGDSGNDRLLGEAGDDILDGYDGDDLLLGGAGNDDLLESRFGDDDLRGGPGDDVLSGLRGHDKLFGDAGDDVLSGGSGPDDFSCGPGEDIAFVNFAAERPRAVGCEHVYDEPGVVHLPCVDGGTDGPETVLGTEGHDRCLGRGDSDDLEGRGGNDILDAGAGDDRAFGRFGHDRLLGGDGADELEGGRGPDVVDGGAGNDQLNGGYDVDVVSGGAGDDRIVARGGGADRITCGPGNDLVYADSLDRAARDCERVRRSGQRR